MTRAAFPSGRKSLLLLALAAIIGGAWWWQRPPPEPMYRGERLSECITRERLVEWTAGPNEQDIKRSRYALRAFGPATVPWLAYTVEHYRQPFNQNGPLPFDNAPHWLRKCVPEMWGGLRALSSNTDQRSDALYALRALGPEAVSAMPAIAGVLEHESEDDDDPNVGGYAAKALHTMGPASWPVVEQMLQHANPHAQRLLLTTIHLRLGTVEKPAAQAVVANAVAALMKACNDPNTDVREGAACGIARCCAARPDLRAFDSWINELIQNLSDSNRYDRAEAERFLALSGANAAPAIPRLIELLDDRVNFVRSNAAWALRDLDMDEKRSAARLRIMFRDDPDANCRKVAGSALKAFGLSQDDESAGPEVLPKR